MLLGLSTGASAQVASPGRTTRRATWCCRRSSCTRRGRRAIRSCPASRSPPTRSSRSRIPTRQEPITVDCWWVNANKPLRRPNDRSDLRHERGLPAGLQCVQGWAVADFQVTLTPGQPIGFTASSGLAAAALRSEIPGPACSIGPDGLPGESGGSVDAVPEDPFRGELKCVQVDANDVPVVAERPEGRGDDRPTTAGGGGPATTAAAYNGIGFDAPEPGDRRIRRSALPRLAASGSRGGRRVRGDLRTVPGRAAPRPLLRRCAARSSAAS